MKTKRLGRTDLDVSIVGLGTAFIGFRSPNDAAIQYADLNRPFDADLDDEQGVAAVIAAMEQGCTLIDTAALYLNRNSERFVGEALERRPEFRETVTVSTKVGQVFGDVDHSYDAVMKHVKGSQKLLGMDRFDVLFIHDAMDVPMDKVMGDDGALGALRQLQEEGVVKWIGSASNDPATNAEYIETGEFDAAVIPECWSLLNQRAYDRIIPAAEKHNTGLITATPLERGLLATGPMEGIDYLARSFTPEIFDHVHNIQSLCTDYGVAMNAVALQWCSRHPQVTSTIPGARTSEEAKTNSEAGDAEIPEALWSDLDPLVQHWPVSQV